jgi:hypothetical protein
VPVEHRESEWAELETRAMRLLEEPALAHPSLKGLTLLRIWLYPSFAPCQSWVVIDEKSGWLPDIEPVVRELTWDRPADRNRLLVNPLEGLKSGFSTSPTIKVRDVAVSRSKLISLIEKGKDLVVKPVIGQRVIVLDGETWGFQTYGVLEHVRLSWWEMGLLSGRNLLVGLWISWYFW